MKKNCICILFIICVFPAFSLENIFSINMEVPFNFETSEYYNNPQTTMLMGMGLNLTDRLYFSDNIGINARITFMFPFFATTIIDYPDPEIFDATYHFPSNILSFGFGISYVKGSFNLDTGPQIRLYKLNNLFAEYSNFTVGFYINPSFIISFNKTSFEVGLSAGMDLYSDSTIKLLLENNRELKYKGGYSMIYFGLYFGLGFSSNKGD